MLLTKSASASTHCGLQAEQLADHGLQRREASGPTWKQSPGTLGVPRTFRLYGLVKVDEGLVPDVDNAASS